MPKRRFLFELILYLNLMHIWELPLRSFHLTASSFRPQILGPLNPILLPNDQLRLSLCIPDARLILLQDRKAAVFGVLPMDGIVVRSFSPKVISRSSQYFSFRICFQFRTYWNLYRVSRNSCRFSRKFVAKWFHIVLQFFFHFYRQLNS